MTCNEIKRIIDDANTNERIVWTVAENTPEQIVLTNSYDRSVKFTILNCDTHIVVRDRNAGVAIEYLFKGDGKADDYNDDETGIRMAIKAAVKYFNETY